MAIKQVNFLLRNMLAGAAFVLLSVTCQEVNASESGHTQLLRNSTLEATAFDKPLLSANAALGKNAALNSARITTKSRELEGVFLSVMLEPMFPTGRDSNLYGGGAGQDIFRTLMIQEYGKAMADGGGIGLAKAIEKQLRQQQ